MNKHQINSQTISNKRKSSFVIFLLVLFVLTSCPVKLAFFAFNPSGNIQHQQKLNKITTAQQLVGHSISTCKVALNNAAEHFQSVLKTPQFKAAVVLLSLFTATFFLCLALTHRAIGNFLYFRKTLIESPLYVRNCLFLI